LEIKLKILWTTTITITTITTITTTIITTIIIIKVNARIKRIDEDAAIIEEEEFTSSKAQRNYTNDLNVITPIPDSKIIKPNIVLAPETEENTETKTNVNSTTTTNNTNKGDKKSTTDSSTLSKSSKFFFLILFLSI